MILAADIGGTKTLIALYQQQQDEWVCCKKVDYSSADFAEFETLLNAFLKDEAVTIQSVCIGVAGPVVDGDCITTNLPWDLKEQEIAVQTGAKSVYLLNDLEATAWGVLALADSDFVELNPESSEAAGSLAILAAGTGLGEAMLIWTGEEYFAVASEGGHTDFAPRNELEIGLLRYLMVMHGEHVSYERVVCGQGLVNIYQYLKSENYAEIDEAMEELFGRQDPAAVISEKGKDSKNKLCAKALELFCTIYGAEAGNLALKCLPKAGVILAGGIAAKNLSSMQNGCFMQGFLAKGRYQQVLRHISVKVCLNPEAALVGALTIAIKNLS